MAVGGKTLTLLPYTKEEEHRGRLLGTQRKTIKQRQQKTDKLISWPVLENTHTVLLFLGFKHTGLKTQRKPYRNTDQY